MLARHEHVLRGSGRLVCPFLGKMRHITFLLFSDDESRRPLDGGAISICTLPMQGMLISSNHRLTRGWRLRALAVLAIPSVGMNTSILSLVLPDN